MANRRTCVHGLKKLMKGKRCYDRNNVHTLGYQIDILLFGAINDLQLTKSIGPPHWFKSFLRLILITYFN